MSATDFRNWLDATIEIIPSFHDGIVAVHFNLYEDTEDKWSVECIGTSSFDPDDEDWACDEVFTSRESPYQWQESTTWDQILEEKIHQLKDYLKTGGRAQKLQEYQGVGIGFVDGDLTVIYQNRNPL